MATEKLHLRDTPSVPDVTPKSDGPLEPKLPIESIVNIYGSLGIRPQQTIPPDVKILIATTDISLSSLNGLQTKGDAWEKLVSVLVQEPCVQPVMDGDIDRAEGLDLTSSSIALNGAHTPRFDKAKLREWLERLVHVEDPTPLLPLTGDQFNIDSILDGIMSDLVQQGPDKNISQKGAPGHDLPAIVNICTVQFPDSASSELRVSRVKVIRWSQRKRTLGVRQNDKAVITGYVNVRRFKPRASAVQSLSSNARKEAITKAENFIRSLVTTSPVGTRRSSGA